MKILCIGMMVCDTLLSPVPNNILELDSVSISKPFVCCGGDALNVAIGLAKLNHSVSLIGRIADDINGKFILNECNKYDIDTARVVYDEECFTAASYVLIDEKGERHFLSEKSIFQKLKGKDVPDKAIENADIIYIGSAMAMGEMDRSGIQDVFLRAHQYGKITAMDAAINIEDPDRDWFRYLISAFMETDIFFPSMDEAIKITGETDPEKIAEYFRPFSMKIFGIKMGDKGCFVTDFAEKRFIECPKNMPVVDTTGAGDSFMAGLISGLVRGWDTFSSTKLALCVAAKNIGAVGGTTGIPDFQEIFHFYENYYQS